MSRRPPPAKPTGRRPPPPRRRASWLRQVFVGLLLVLGMGLLGLGTGVGLMVWQIPSIETLLAARPMGATTVYDREGRVIASVQNGENREIVPLEEISKELQQAVVASEDIRFYDHYGIDPKGLLRAVFMRGERGGGSTLTQQLAKNLFLSSDRTPARKIADIWLALQLERKLSKPKILEMYLNQVYFGHGAYGVQNAARKYFGKKARDINAAEAAQLAGLLPAPEYYSPYRNPKIAKDIQLIVLRRMVDAGYLEAAQAEKEGKRPLRFANTPDYAYRAPYFTSYVLQVLSDRLGRDLVMRGALKIYTTLDLRLQEEAEATIRNGVARYRPYKVGQGAMVAIEPGTGAVRALVGGTSYDASQFNRATQAKRQPGSTFKPFVYLAAFAKGQSPGSSVADAPVDFGGYKPLNYDHRFHGVVSYERALAFSYNVPAVRVADSLGIDEVIRMAHTLGIQSGMPPELSVALGSAEVTPLELATAYATIAADGVYAEPHVISRVEDPNGQLIDQFPVTAAPVVPDSAVWALHKCLSAVVTYGTGAAANIGRPAGGKTGTTSENRDTWFAGYTPDLACVVWLGNDDNSRLASSATGGQLAAPLWARFMRTAHLNLPVRALRTYGGGATGTLGGGEGATVDPAATVDPNAVEATPTPLAEDPNALPTPAAEGSPLDEPLPASQDSPDALPPARTPEPLPEGQGVEEPLPVPSSPDDIP